MKRGGEELLVPYSLGCVDVFVGVVKVGGQVFVGEVEESGAVFFIPVAPFWFALGVVVFIVVPVVIIPFVIVVVL